MLQPLLKRGFLCEPRPGASAVFLNSSHSTLPVKTGVQAKDFLVAWRSGMDNVQHTLKITFQPHRIRFLIVDNEDGVPYDMSMVLCLHSLTRSRIFSCRFPVPGDSGCQGHPNRELFSSACTVELPRQRVYTYISGRRHGA